MANDIALSKPDNSYLTDPAKFEHIWRVAKAFSMSTLMPESIRGKPEDCFILAQLSMRLNVDLFMLAQNTYVVHGRPGMEAKLQIGLLNASGRIRGNIAYQFSGEGDAYGCSACVVDAATGEKIVGPKVDKRMVKAEGWDKKTGSKWLTMPEVMFRYRAASLLIRVHYPEVTLGLLTREELEEEVIDVESTLASPALPPGQSKSEAIAALVANKADPTAQDEAKAAPRKRGRPRKEQQPVEVAVEPDHIPEPKEMVEEAVEEPEKPDPAPDPQPLLEQYTLRMARSANVMELDEVRNDMNADQEVAAAGSAIIAALIDAYQARWKSLS